MSRQTSTVTIAVRFLASVMLIVIGAAWLGGLATGPMSFPGKLVAAAGAAGVLISAAQWVAAVRSRRDPYDLSRLWDEPPPAPEEPDREADPDALVLCHRCGASMPAHVGTCIECGNRLGY